MKSLNISPFLTFVAAIVIATTTAGCTSSWWQNFENDPIAKVQAFEQQVSVVEGFVNIAYSVTYPLLPAADQVIVAEKYNTLLASVNDAENTLNATVQADVDLKTTPDFTKVMQDVSDAVTGLVAFVNDMKNLVAQKNPSAMRATAPPGLGSLPKAVETMKHIGHTK